MRIQGQIHHRIGPLEAKDDELPPYLINNKKKYSDFLE